MLRRTRSVRRGAGPRSFRPVLEALEDRWLPAVSFYAQTNLAADEPGVARIHDPELVNAWGISLSLGGGAFWVSANGTGVSTLYLGDVNGSAFVKAGLTVTIPGGQPTGQVFNALAPDFVVRAGAAGAPAIFIFATETGFVTGWSPVVPAPGARVAQVAVANPGRAEYTGLAQGSNAAGNFLYAADFANGEIDVFNATFQATTLAGNFTDPGIPDGYAPFNIQNLGGKLFVTYARQDNDGELAKGGNGFVSVFDTNGNFERRFASGGPLHAPWGLARAPADFGEFSNAVLVGNHGNGRIHAFDMATGALLGALRGESGGPVRIDGLWGLAFGNGVSAGDRNALYFAAGPRGGLDGLFGSLRAVERDDPKGGGPNTKPGAAVPSVAGAAPVIDEGPARLFGVLARPGAIGPVPSGAASSVAERPATVAPVAPAPGATSAGAGDVTVTPADGVAAPAADALFALSPLFGDDPFTAVL